MSDTPQGTLLFKPCGLENSGNSCYVNAVLQSITAVPIFQRKVAYSDGRGAKYLMIKHFLRAANRGQVFSPRLPKLSASAQEDAHEYMLQLARGIPRWCDIFVSKMNIESKCTETGCNGCSFQHDQPCFDIDIPVTGIKDIREGFVHFTHGDFLQEGWDRCDSCGVENIHPDRTRYINDFADCLIVKATRFKELWGGHRVKDAGKIYCPPILRNSELAQLHHTGTGPGEDYMLISIVAHHGELSNGHYTAYTRYGKLWYECNDDKIAAVSQEKVCSDGSGYMFYFCRQSLLPPSYEEVPRNIVSVDKRKPGKVQQEPSNPRCASIAQSPPTQFPPTQFPPTQVVPPTAADDAELNDPTEVDFAGLLDEQEEAMQRESQEGNTQELFQELRTAVFEAEQVQEPAGRELPPAQQVQGQDQSSSQVPSQEPAASFAATNGHSDFQSTAEAPLVAFSADCLNDLHFLDNIDAKHFTEFRCNVSRMIPKEFQKPWSVLLMSLMSHIHACYSQESPPAMTNRAVVLLWMLPRLLLNVPSRKIDESVRFEGFLSHKPAMRRRFRLARDGKFDELFEIYLQNCCQGTGGVGNTGMDKEAQANKFCALVEAHEDSRANASLHSSGIAPTNDDTKNALRQLIVQQTESENEACKERLQQRAKKGSSREFTVHWKVLLKALRQLSRYSAAAASGWRNEFLKALCILDKDTIQGSIAPFFATLMQSKIPGFAEWMRFVKLVPLKKKKGGIRPIGISEPFSKVTEKLWMNGIKDSAERILSPFQFGCFFKAGGEAMCRTFQYENDLFQESIAKVDGKNFFNSILRDALVDGAAQISEDFEIYAANELSIPTSYFLYDSNGQVCEITTMVGTIQGRSLSSLLTCLAMIPAQKEFVNTIKFRYPFLNVVGADSEIEADSIREENLAELPDFDTFCEECPENKDSQTSLLSNVAVALRAYIDDQTLRCPKSLVQPCISILSKLMRPLGVEFNERSEVWNSVAEPESGIILLGVPMWGVGKREIGEDDSICHGIGSKQFINENLCPQIKARYTEAIDKLREVMQHAPKGRDVGASVERILRVCIVPRHTHIARAYPPSLIRKTLQECDDLTAQCLMNDVYGWSRDRFWNKAHEKAVKLNVQLPCKFTGAGIIPQHALCDAAYAASWLQPLETIAKASNTGNRAILTEWNENASSPSIHELRNSLSKLGHSSDLIELYEAYEEAKAKHFDLMQKRLEKGEDISEWQFRFNWQKFLSKGIWKQRFESYQDHLAKSNLPFLSFEKERIEARRDAFAQRCFDIIPDDSRLRLHLDDFRISRSYFFGVPLFPPWQSDGQVCFGFCHMKNDKGNVCGMKNVDCFGHHAFLCPCTSKHTEHNAIRNVVNAECKGLGFITEKEVAMPQFNHRADNLLTDLEADRLPIAIDITIRALHQQGIRTGAKVIEAAVKSKQIEGICD